MATVFYIRKGAKQDRVASSREVSVADLFSLYGPASANYTFMEGADSPTTGTGHGAAAPGPDAEHVVVRIEGNEVNRDIFPQEGFYRVDADIGTE